MSRKAGGKHISTANIVEILMNNRWPAHDKSSSRYRKLNQFDKYAEARAEGCKN